jgi:hypothetical protein
MIVSISVDAKRAAINADERHHEGDHGFFRGLERVKKKGKHVRRSV